MDNSKFRHDISLDEKSFALSLSVFIFALVSLIYHEALFYGVSNYDDHKYFDYLRESFKDGVTFNSFLSILTDFVNSNWHPVTMLSLAIDFIVSGDNPIYFHAVNIVIHIANVILVFVIFNKLFDNRVAASLTAVIFAIHPLNVDTIIWISERKGLLSTFFSLGAFYCYILYKKYNLQHYKPISILLYMFGLLSKPTIAPIIIIFIMFDLLVDENCKKIELKIILRSVKDKAPYFIVFLGVIAFSFMAQSERGALSDLSTFSVLARLEISVNNIFTYLVKIFTPINLASFYPITSNSAFITIINIVLIFSLTALLGRYFSGLKVFLFCVLFFYIQIIPLSGLFQTGSHSFANRYAYIPAIGIYFIISEYLGRISNRTIYVICVLIIVLSLSTLSFNYAKTWRSDLDLWKNNAHTAERNYYAAYNYSIQLINNNKIDEAARYFYNIIGIENKFYAVNAIEGIVTELIQHNYNVEAKMILDKSIKNNFNNKEIYRQLALLEYFSFNNKDTALQYINSILLKFPLDFKTNRIYAKILFEEKRYKEALDILNKLINNKYIGGSNQDKQSIIDNDMKIILEKISN